MQYKACVFGNPVEQSKSPFIHETFAKQCDVDFEYVKQSPEIKNFLNSASEFLSAAQVVGANITVPFKEQAFSFVDELSLQAKRAGAVNTFIKKDGKVIGENTDGIGLVQDLRRNGVILKDARVLLIGAGGAAKGALPALIDAEVGAVQIYNRTENRAKDLVEYAESYCAEKLSLYDGVSKYDLIINATTLSLSAKLPALPDSIYANSPVCYDMVYLNKPTVFMTHAESLGCLCIDGLGMLVGQAAESFYYWFDKRPDVEPVLRLLRSAL